MQATSLFIPDVLVMLILITLCRGSGGVSALAGPSSPRLLHLGLVNSGFLPSSVQVRTEVIRKTPEPPKEDEITVDPVTIPVFLTVN